ncbi:MAG TPA: murein L,D-transpeptidase catalytic domain family protein [Bacteroidia bacterium]|nr:murein L,D-transpeptidase catalytic domain family protein [Bacteroidia bacterium]
MRIFFILFCLYFLPATEPAINQDKVTHTKDFALSQSCRSDYAIFIDMSLPSNEKRWYVVSLDSMKIIYKTYVAHGRGSGIDKQASCFSDKPGSYCTALGIYKIAGSYMGEHGLSYSLEGLEVTNKNAFSRGIVIHSAWYANEDLYLTMAVAATAGAALQYLKKP